MARKVRLFVPLDPVALALKLKAEVEREATATEEQAGRIFGKGTEERIELYWARAGRDNDVSAKLVGYMAAEKGGTVIYGTLGRATGSGLNEWFAPGFALFVCGIAVFTPGPLLVKGAILALGLWMLWNAIRSIGTTRTEYAEDEKLLETFLRDRLGANALPLK